MERDIQSKSQKAQTHRTYLEYEMGKTTEREKNSTITMVITGGLL